MASQRRRASLRSHVPRGPSGGGGHDAGSTWSTRYWDAIQPRAAPASDDSRSRAASASVVRRAISA